jgi:hypothetical protein
MLLKLFFISNQGHRMIVVSFITFEVCSMTPVWPIDNRLSFFDLLFAGMTGTAKPCVCSVRISSSFSAHLICSMPWRLVLASGTPVKMNAREPNQAQNSESSIQVMIGTI